MEQFVERCAGLDVHKRSVTACVRVPGKGKQRESHIKTFGTTKRELALLCQWLMSFGVTLAGMESTGVYWKPVFFALEEQMTCWLLNAQHIKNVPGRKTDVADASWIAQLLEFGLVRPSFVPGPLMRALRELTRYRKSLIHEHTREGQRLDKVLQSAGIKLSSVVSDLLGVASRSMIVALADGERNPKTLANMAIGRMRSKIPELEKALEGHFGTEHVFLVKMILERLTEIEAKIEVLNAEITSRLAEQKENIERLDTIPGVNVRTAEVIIAEAGAEIAHFESPEQLASWAGLCPGNNESAGKHYSGKTRRGSRQLRTALVEAATAASRSRNTYLSAQYHRLKARRGHGRAIVAVAHSILVISYYLLVRGETYRELGGDYFTERQKDRRIASLLRQLQDLGQHVTIVPAG